MRALVLFSLIAPIQANAFDPFTAAMAVKSVSDIANSASEVSGVMDAFTELYTEIDTDATISEQGQKMIEQIHEIDDLAHEAGYTAEDIQEIGTPSVDEAKRLENALRTLTKAVKASKRTLRLFQKLEKKAQNAQIESTQIEKEQLAMLYKIAQEEQAANLNQVKDNLKAQIEKRNQIKGLRKTLKEKGVRWFQASGALAFPKGESIMESAIETSKSMRGPLLGLMLLVFLGRIVFYQVSFFGRDSYGDLIRDAIVCSFLMLAYPEIVRGILSISFALANSVTGGNVKDIQTQKIQIPKFEGVSFATALGLTYIYELLKAGAFLIVDFFMTFGTAFMVILFPLVIFFSQMLNFAVGWPIFVGGFAILSLWPLFWNLIGLCGELVWNKSESLGVGQLYSVFLTILQFCSPIIGVSLLSGSGVGKSIKDAVMPGAALVGGLTGQAAQGKAAFQEAVSQGHSDGTSETETSWSKNLKAGPGRAIGYASGRARVLTKPAPEPERTMSEEYIDASKT